jgi:hypothetical protein
MVSNDRAHYLYLKNKVFRDHGHTCLGLAGKLPRTLAILANPNSLFVYSDFKQPNRYKTHPMFFKNSVEFCFLQAL